MSGVVVRALLLALLTAKPVPCAGPQISVTVPVQAIAHPIRAWKSLPSTQKLMMIADMVLEGANTVDYITTRRGAFPGTGGCELNPLLTTAACQIDVPRFTAIKLAVGVFGVAQWLPVFAGWGGTPWVCTVTLIDAALAIPLAIADVNNVIQLKK